MNTNELFKGAYNQCLDVISALTPGAALPTEAGLAEALGVSRTTVRSILQRLSEFGVIGVNGRRKTLLRSPSPIDHFSQNVVESVSKVAEKRVMAWLVGPDCAPGQIINALDLSRRLGLSTSSIRDCLKRFEHYGLVVRQENGRWRCLGLTRELVVELFEIREIQEARAIERFVLLPDGHAARGELMRISARHREHLANPDLLLREFTEYDAQLHLTITSVANNRFFIESHEMMGLIFPYHYDNDIIQNQGRQLQATKEHLVYIEALISRDLIASRSASRQHLTSACATLLDSIESKTG